MTVAQNRLTRRQDLTATIAELAKIQIAALELQANRQYTLRELQRGYIELLRKTLDA